MLDYDLPFRMLLIVGSILTLVFILTRIRQAKVQIEDSLFWFVFPLLLLLLSVFPGLAFHVAGLFGFQSPVNVVYLAIIFLLIIKQFSMTLRISKMDTKIQNLAQQIALNEEKIERDKTDK